jgi:hypothetical protein
MKIKGKRTLKNGVLAGYVLQKDGSWKWSFLKGGKKNIEEGRLKKLKQYRIGNDNNPTLRSKLKNLSLSLKQKHLASPKIFGHHDNKVYKQMHKDLELLLKNSNDNKYIAKKFLNNNNSSRRVRIKKSINKWTKNKKKCETRRCKKQRIATNLIQKDIKTIDDIITESLKKKGLESNNSKLSKFNETLRTFYNCYFRCNNKEYCCTKEKNEFLDNYFNNYCRKNETCDSMEFLTKIFENLEEKYGNFIKCSNEEINEIESLENCLKSNKVYQLFGKSNKKTFEYKRRKNRIKFTYSTFIKVDPNMLFINPIQKPYELIINKDEVNANEVKYIETKEDFNKNYIIINYPVFSEDGNKILINIKNIEQDIINQKREKYELLGVVGHKGRTIHEGHYVAYVRRGKEIYYCDDLKKQITTINNFNEINQGRFTPYILLYKKKNHEIPDLGRPKVLENFRKSYYNVCYGNSVLQLLFSIPELSEIINDEPILNNESKPNI